MKILAYEFFRIIDEDVVIFSVFLALGIARNHFHLQKIWLENWLEKESVFEKHKQDMDEATYISITIPRIIFFISSLIIVNYPFSIG